MPLNVLRLQISIPRLTIDCHVMFVQKSKLLSVWLWLWNVISTHHGKTPTRYFQTESRKLHDDDQVWNLGYDDASRKTRPPWPTSRRSCPVLDKISRLQYLDVGRWLTELNYKAICTLIRWILTWSPATSWKLVDHFQITRFIRNYSQHAIISMFQPSIDNINSLDWNKETNYDIPLLLPNLSLLQYPFTVMPNPLSWVIFWLLIRIKFEFGFYLEKTLLQLTCLSLTFYQSRAKGGHDDDSLAFG